MQGGNNKNYGLRRFIRKYKRECTDKKGRQSRPKVFYN